MTCILRARLLALWRAVHDLYLIPHGVAIRNTCRAEPRTRAYATPASHAGFTSSQLPFVLLTYTALVPPVLHSITFHALLY